MACGISSCSTCGLVPQPGIEPGPPLLGAQGLSHWTTRDILLWFFMVLDSGSTGFKPSSRLQAYHSVTHLSSLGLRSHPIFLPVSPGSPVCDFSLHLSPVEPHSRLLRQRSAWRLLLIVLNTGPTLHLQPPWTLASYQLPCRLL